MKCKLFSKFDFNMTQSDLLLKRKKSYLYLFIFQITAYIIAYVLLEMASQGKGIFSLGFVTVLHLLSLLSMSLASFNIVYRFMNIRIKVLFATVLLLNIIFGNLIFYPYSTLSADTARTLYIFTQILFLISMGTILYIVINDIFTQRHDLSYSLLGAVNIYLIITAVFAGIFSIYEASYPGIITGVEILLENIYLVSHIFSIYLMVGIDVPGFEGANNIIKQIGLLEALISNIFIIFIVGRLLTKNT